MNEQRVVELGQATGIAWRERAVSLGLEGVEYQMLKGRHRVGLAEIITNRSHHRGCPGHDRWREIFRFGDSRDSTGVQQIATGFAQDSLTLLPRWHGQFKNHVEAADEGGIDPANGVGEPQGRHRIILEHPVNPRLAHLRRALNTKESVTIVEDVLDFVENDQRPTLCEKALCGAKSAQALFTSDRITVYVIARNLKQFAPHFHGQSANQLTFARPRNAVKEDVDASPPRGGRMAKVGMQDLKRRPDMTVVRQA